MAVRNAPMMVITMTIRPGDDEVTAIVGLVEPHPIDDDHRAGRERGADPGRVALHERTGPCA